MYIHRCRGEPQLPKILHLNIFHTQPDKELGTFPIGHSEAKHSTCLRQVLPNTSAVPQESRGSHSSSSQLQTSSGCVFTHFAQPCAARPLPHCGFVRGAEARVDEYIRTFSSSSVVTRSSSVPSSPGTTSVSSVFGGLWLARCLEHQAPLMGAAAGPGAGERTALAGCA